MAASSSSSSRDEGRRSRSGSRQKTNKSSEAMETKHKKKKKEHNKASSSTHTSSAQHSSSSASEKKHRRQAEGTSEEEGQNNKDGYGYGYGQSKKLSEQDAEGEEGRQHKRRKAKKQQEKKNKDDKKNQRGKKRQKVKHKHKNSSKQHKTGKQDKAKHLKKQVQKKNKPTYDKSVDSEAGTAATDSDNEEFLVWDRLRLTRRDFRCLAPGCDLNDSIMDFSLRLIHRYLAPRTDVHIFSSLFFTRLMAAGAADGDAGWENVRGWAKNISLFSYEHLLLPMNSEAIDSDKHWWLAVVRLRAPDRRVAPSVTWFDSLNGPDERYSVALRYLRGYLRREWTERPSSRPNEVLSHGDGVLDKDLGLDVSGLESSAMEIVPQQRNGVDCGVFLLENVLRFLNGADCTLGRCGGNGLDSCNANEDSGGIGGTNSSTGGALKEGRAAFAGAVGSGSTGSNKEDSDDTGDISDSAGALIWCNQTQATRRRADLQSSMERLVSGIGKQGCGRSVPDNLETRPDLMKWLLEVWALPLAFQQAVDECAMKDRGAQATLEFLNGSWVRQGEFVGRIEAAVLRGPGNDEHAMTKLASFKFRVTLDREYVVLIGFDGLIWDDGDIWKRMVVENEEKKDMETFSSSNGSTSPRLGVRPTRQGDAPIGICQPANEVDEETNQLTEF